MRTVVKTIFTAITMLLLLGFALQCGDSDLPDRAQTKPTSSPSSSGANAELPTGWDGLSDWDGSSWNVTTE